MIHRGLVRPFVRPLARRLVGAASSVWAPSVLYGGGEGGYYFAESDSTTTFQDDARTTPAGNGDPLGGLTDLSGNGHHATQGIASRRPTLTAASDKWYGEYDAIDDVMNITVGAGILKNSAGATFWGLCQHDSIATNARSFVAWMNLNGGSLKYWFGRDSTAAQVGGEALCRPAASSSTAIINPSGPTLADVTAFVFTIDCSTESEILYYNGSQVGAASTTVGDFEDLAEANAGLGAYTSVSLWNGKISHVGCIDRVLTSDERTNLDAWLTERAWT